jgi:hypothetical protein
MKLPALVTLAACLLTVVTGCASTPTLTPTSKVVLQESAGIAMRQFLRDHPKYLADSSHIREVAKQLQAATEVTTVTELAALASTEINKRVTDPLDREDFLALVRMADTILKEQIGHDNIDSAARVAVNEFIDMLVAVLPAPRTT